MAPDIGTTYFVDSSNVTYKLPYESSTIIAGGWYMSTDGSAFKTGIYPLKILLPEYIEGYKVTQIYYRAFCRTKITSIYIPATIETIGWDAFSYTPLKEVIFAEGSNITSIGDRAFYSCRNLKELRLPPHLSSIGKLALGNCSIHNLYFCGSLVIDSSINLFGETNDYAVRHYPNSIYVKINYESDSFADCKKVRKLNICSPLFNKITKCQQKIVSLKAYSMFALIYLML